MKEFKLKDHTYNLISTITRKVIKYNIVLNDVEVDTINYAYNVNGIKRCYIKSTDGEVVKFKHQFAEELLSIL